MFDGKAFGEEIVGIMQDYVARQLAPMIAENVALAERIAVLEARPEPEKGETGDKGDDGLSPAPEAVAEALRPFAETIASEAVAKAVAELPPPEKGDRGDDADMGVVGEMIAAEVAKAVEAIPVPKDGEDGKDAAGIVEALKDSGELVLTLQDGRLVRTGIRDGEKGKDGRDGFSLDDFDCAVLEDDRTLQLSFRSGGHENIATLKWPTAIYRGVFKEGQEYERGDTVTWAGSLWHCDEPTKDKPGTDSWTLSCKKGRDGKDAKHG